MDSIVALDPGFGETKVALLYGGKVLSFSFPSLVAEHSPAPLETEDRVVIEWGGKKYVVGRHARVESGCRELYDFEDLVRVLPLLLEFATHDKVLSDVSGEKVEGFDYEAVIVSVAPGCWPEKEKAEKALTYKSKETIVVPQGLGGYWTVKEELPEGIEYVLVLDLGYNTVDWILIEHGEKFQVLKGATLYRMGVMKLVELFKGELKAPISEMPPRVLREFLKKGGGKVYGEWLDMSGPKARAVEKYAETLLAALKGAVGDLTGVVDALVGVGGGVHYFDLGVLGHRNVVIPEKPERANVEGQLKMAALSRWSPTPP